MGKGNIGAVLFFFMGGLVFAQEQRTSELGIVKSIDGIVQVTFDLLSGKEGRNQDWKGLRNFYLPKARFTIPNHPGNSGLPQNASLSVDEFIEYMNENRGYYEDGFVQYGSGKWINEFNGIADVFQSFYAKDSENKC